MTNLIRIIRKNRDSSGFNNSSYHFNKKILLTYYLFLVILLIYSCGPIGKYNPHPSIANGVIKNITINNAVKISNDQPSKEEHKLEFRDIIVNYHDFTESLIEGLKLELIRNKVEVSEDANKELFVAITKIEMPPAKENFRAYINAEVRTGDGQKEKFIVTRASYASPLNMNIAAKKPLNSSFRDLIKEIMANEVILRYLNN